MRFRLACLLPMALALGASARAQAPPARDEAYILRAGAEAAVVAGNDDAGAFYGLQSLRQLIVKDGARVRVRGAEVEDWPHVPFRAIRLYLPGHENIAFFKRFLRSIC